ncbi:hypothetical protein TNIN_256751 [Trichonephila inaurata madagascariensis]|uniref:Uncharacterized protein n=1 Tax=Trichonephila inaurata madagascariensis TaxID=2747483 RepID=A0A8X6MEV7_9ARAC|nr:hypothetical protein TNIN_256751 [Trichonephila inaurata madagascariensis]
MINSTTRRSYDDDHISRRAFNDWKGLTRLRRSSTHHLDRDIRKEILLEHFSLGIHHEPILPIRPPAEAEINLNLLVSFSKKESTQTLLKKGVDTIHSLSHGNCAIIFADGPSDNSFTRGGVGIQLIHPSGAYAELKIPTGQIVSNFSLSIVN